MSMLETFVAAAIVFGVVTLVGTPIFLFLLP